MEYVVEKDLSDFEFWSGAKSNAEMLTSEELDEIGENLGQLWEETPTETQINDLFWFDFGTACELIGLSYDEEKDEVVRD